MLFRGILGNISVLEEELGVVKDEICGVFINVKFLFWMFFKN